MRFSGRCYTPLGLTKTILYPSTNGGANWGGGSFDPETQTLYVNTMEIGFVLAVGQKAGRFDHTVSARKALRTPNGRFWDS